MVCVTRRIWRRCEGCGGSFEFADPVFLERYHSQEKQDGENQSDVRDAFHGFSPFLHSVLSIAWEGMLVKG